MRRGRRPLADCGLTRAKTTAPPTTRRTAPIYRDVGLIDGLPRSASCTAGTDVVGAVLTRADLILLQQENPSVCAKLIMAIAMRIGARLRENTEKLKRYVQLTKAMQQEIDHLMPT